MISWMSLAIAMADHGKRFGEIPVGCVLVQDNRMIACTSNYVERWRQPLAHGEILVMLLGQKKLQTPYLERCRLYVTLEPCNFCFEALKRCRIGGIVFGNYRTTWREAPPIEIIGGVEEDTCKAMMDAFFQEKRTPRE